MKKRLTKEQFNAVIQHLPNLKQQTIEMAYGVLVEGKSQSHFASIRGISHGAVSQAIKRIWTIHIDTWVPEGYEKVTVVLPESKAFIVKKWEAELTTK